MRAGGAGGRGGEVSDLKGRSKGRIGKGRARRERGSRLSESHLGGTGRRRGRQVRELLPGARWGGRGWGCSRV